VRSGLWLIAVAVAVAGCAPVTPLHRSATAAGARTGVGAGVQPLPTGQLPTRGAPLGVSTQTSASANSQSGQGNAPPEPLSPFDDSPVIIAVAGQHFSSGERVIVTVCLGADHSIKSADIFESSGDSKFDQLAVMWARRIRLREATPGDQIASCGSVRVEVRPAQEPRVFHPPGDSLS
jgi:outer membrane biosynthesis protein TonB